MVWVEIRMSQIRSSVLSIDSSQTLSVGTVSVSSLASVKQCFLAAKLLSVAGPNLPAQAALVIAEVGWVGSVGYGHVPIQSLRTTDYLSPQQQNYCAIDHADSQSSQHSPRQFTVTAACCRRSWFSVAVDC